MKWEYWVVSYAGQIMGQYTNARNARLKQLGHRYWRVFKCRILRKSEID